MSDEEARDFFKTFFKHLGANSEHIRKNGYCQSSLRAIEALEKQIPKKVTLSGDAYVDGELYYDTASCPACDCVFEDETDFGFNHCPNCGQALDWSDVE